MRQRLASGRKRRNRIRKAGYAEYVFPMRNCVAFLLLPAQLQPMRSELFGLGIAIRTGAAANVSRPELPLATKRNQKRAWRA